MLNKAIADQLTTCRVFSTVSQEEDEEAWKAARGHGIGGSDVGAICGVSPFTSARQIYLNKTGQYPETFSPSTASVERMRWGHLLEPVVADEFANKTGAKLVSLGATMQHKDFPWALANIDRLIVDDDGKPIGILEVKTTGEYNNDEWEEGDILLSYIYQLNWYLWILGLERGAFACLVGGNKFYYYDVFRNDELLNDTIIPTVKKFWEENICKMVEPEMQATDKDFANSIFSTVVKNSEKKLDDDVSNDLARTVVECKAQIKQLTATMEEAQNRLKDRLKDVEIGYTPDFTIKWSPCAQKRVDSDVLKKNFPDVYEQCLKRIEFRKMTIKGVV